MYAVVVPAKYIIIKLWTWLLKYYPPGGGSKECFAYPRYTVSPRVPETLFPGTRSTDTSLRENPDGKYFFIMENHFPKKFETRIFWDFFRDFWKKWNFEIVIENFISKKIWGENRKIKKKSIFRFFLSDFCFQKKMIEKSLIFFDFFSHFFFQGSIFFWKSLKKNYS